MNILSLAKESIRIQSDALKHMSESLTSSFHDAIHCIMNCKGKIVISGVGKSAIIGQKIAATFNSTGTQSVFLHAVDALHGDLGIVDQKDVCIVISKSGNSDEIKNVVASLRFKKNPIIALTGNMTSYLSQHADFILNTSVEKEVCPNNLAPTTSTTAQMVMGDALAVVLMKLKKFTANDFAQFHPLGNLGKTLTTKIDDIMDKTLNPTVESTSKFKDIIHAITVSRLGAVAIIDAEKKIKGIITDGDIRRLFADKNNFFDLTAEEIMTKNPKTLKQGMLAIEALKFMKDNEISQVIVEAESRFVGLVHIHEILKEGITL